MSQQRVATELDQAIQADRQRRKHEDLAKEIFGNKKHIQATRSKDTRKPINTPSLASRIGIAKRSSSASGTHSPRNLPSRPSSAAAQHARNSRLAAEITNQQTTNIVTSKASAGGLSIKGSAAPFVVEAQNFAPGTSEADIINAIKPNSVDRNGNSALVNCKIVATKPIVIAELIFNDRSIADTIVSKYDKQTADGHKLELRITRSGPGSMSKHHAKSTVKSQAVPTSTAAPPVEDDDLMQDVDAEQPSIAANNSYDQERKVAEKDRRDRESRRDRDERDTERRHDDTDRRNDDYNRENGGDRDRDRGRDRGHERSDQDEPQSYRRSDGPGSNRSSHYGNGVGGTARPAYGSGYAGGRGNYPAYDGYGGRGGFRRGGYRGFNR